MLSVNRLSVVKLIAMAPESKRFRRKLKAKSTEILNLKKLNKRIKHED
jgi:hypothetical protein